MAAVDEDFFIRLKQSRLLQEDRDSEHKMYHWPFFNATDFNEVDYYKRFPTIYHLRAWLMQTDEQADLRLIYLALHNIVKTRGNFLHQDNPSLSAEKSDMKSSVIDLCNVLKAWCDNRDIICSCKADEIESVLENIGDSRRSKQGTLELLFGLSSEDKKTIGKQISSALVGFVANFAQISPGEVDDAKFKLSDDEKTDAYAETLSDEDRELFDAVRIVYSSYILMGILKNNNGEPYEKGPLAGMTGKTLSFCKIHEFETYKTDLAVLKALVKEYVPQEYKAFFRGEFYEGTHDYNFKKAQGYTKYNAVRKTSYDEFSKTVKSYSLTPQLYRMNVILQ